MAEILIGHIRGGKGDPGAGLKILDYYATFEALSSAVTNPEAGDAYGVGDDYPYDIYVYSETHGWVNNGSLQPDINEQTPNYAEATTLEPLASGEKISLAFGKIKKAISDFILHLADTTKHVTSSDRTSWNGKAPGKRGLGEQAFGNENISFVDTMQQGGGFYQVLTDEDTPHSSKEWLGLLQVTRNNKDVEPTGMQLAFYDFNPSKPKMWFRTLLEGVAGPWFEMLHTNNIDDYRHKIVTGAYTGDSTGSRKISLGFTPDVVIVFGKSGMVSFLTPQNGYRGCGGMAFKGFPCKVGDVATIEIVDGGFNVSYIAPNGDATVNVPMSNEANAQYYYMAIRNPIK